MAGAALVVVLLAYTKPKEGVPVPPFSALTHNNERVSLADLVGRKAILFFYPRAGSPRCSAEGRGFQKHLPAFEAANVRVVGISNDKVAANAKFAEQNGFTFPLLSDIGNKVAMAFGAAQRRYDPHRRVAALIDEEGVLIKWYDPAGTADFAERVLADVQSGIAAPTRHAKRREDTDDAVEL